jgi:hypothetical protein
LKEEKKKNKKKIKEKKLKKTIKNKSYLNDWMNHVMAQLSMIFGFKCHWLIRITNMKWKHFGLFILRTCHSQ